MVFISRKSNPAALCCTKFGAFHEVVDLDLLGEKMEHVQSVSNYYVW